MFFRNIDTALYYGLDYGQDKFTEAARAKAANYYPARHIALAVDSDRSNIIREDVSVDRTIESLFSCAFAYAG